MVKSTDLERELDPQPMQRLLDRYGQAVRKALGDRGASVGKRHGDGFMAAFGVPELHEDDALRAVRAAAELRAALDELAEEVRQQRGLEFHVRLGINTGNVLVRDAGTLEEELTGTAVNLAKRFEEAAGAGEILLGEETYRLVADAVKAEPAGPLTVKGAAEPQSVWRLLEVLPDRPGRARRPIAPMVGRGREQELLLRLFERAAAEGTCHLVSVLGSAGVGKSRLVDEFVVGLGDQAAVLRGHCPAFGDSVTMWPMVEVVRQAAGIAPDDSAEQARARLAELLGGEERGTLVTERIAQLLGFGQDTGLPEDTFWALQRLLETLARRRPLVLVIDDLHWADPILLDAVEHVAEHADAPLVLLCMARPDELFPRRQHWPGGKANALSFQLSPLPEREGEQLVVHLLGGRVDQAVQAHVSEWAQGFPLLVEELVTNLRDEGWLRAADGRWTLKVESEEAAERRARTVPTSIHALLLARLDRLGPRGRAVIEPAAVVGQQFHLGDVEALHPDAPPADLAAGLQELVRLDLIRADHGPTSAPLPPNSGPGYRFRHATIKTVAYERLPDDRRAELHERYADWLERETEDRRSQFDEIVAHHFYEAYRYTRRLDPGGDRVTELARRAGERYAAAGQRAAVRGDTRLVQAWLGRAARLLPAEHPLRLAALPPLAEAQQSNGRLTEATRAYQELARSATAVGNEGLALHATIGRLGITAVHDPTPVPPGGPRRGRAGHRRLRPPRRPAGPGQGLAPARLPGLDQGAADPGRGRRRAGQGAGQGGQGPGLGGQRHRHALPDPLLGAVAAGGRWSGAAARRSPRPSAAACPAWPRPPTGCWPGWRPTGATWRRRGGSWTRPPPSPGRKARCCPGRWTASRGRWWRCSAGDLAAAEEVLRGGYRQLEEMGGTGPRVNVATLLARVRLLRGRNDDAEELTRTCERLAAPDQADAQVKWRSIRAIAIARRGELGDGERLAREAVYLAGKTDQLDSRAETHVDLAEVLLLGGRGREAEHELDRAIALFQEKGNEVGERSARRLLARTRS